MAKVSPIKFSGPESEKLKELEKTLSENIIEKEEIGDYFSEEGKIRILEKKDVLLKILNKELDSIISKLDKATKEGFSEDFGIELDSVKEKEIKDIFKIDKNILKEQYVEIFLSTQKSFFTNINKLEEEQDLKGRKFLFEKLRKYKPKNKEEKSLLFVPIWEQDIYDEYDILAYVKNDVLSQKEKEEVIELTLDYDLEISRIYNQLVVYLKENTELERIAKIYELIETLEKEEIMFLKEYDDILKANKFVYEETNYDELYEEEISLFREAGIEGLAPYDKIVYDEGKLNEIRKKYKDNIFDSKFNKGYFKLDFIVIEEFVPKENLEFNEKFFKSLEEQYIETNEYLSEEARIEFEKNKDLDLFVRKEEIVIHENKRKDIEIIKRAFVKFIEENEIVNVKDNAYIYHFLYEDENGNDIEKKEEYIKLV